MEARSNARGAEGKQRRAKTKRIWQVSQDFVRRLYDARMHQMGRTRLGLSAAAAAAKCNHTLNQMVRAPELTLDSDEIDPIVLWTFPPAALNELVAKLRADFVAQNPQAERIQNPCTFQDQYLSDTVVAAVAQGGEHDPAERQDACKDQQEEWTHNTAAQGSRTPEDSDQDAGGGAAEKLTGDGGMRDETDVHGNKLLSSLISHKAHIAEALLQGQGEDLAVVARWFTCSPAVGDDVFRASCEGKPTLRTKSQLCVLSILGRKEQV